MKHAMHESGHGCGVIMYLTAYSVHYCVRIWRIMERLLTKNKRPCHKSTGEILEMEPEAHRKADGSNLWIQVVSSNPLRLVLLSFNQPTCNPQTFPGRTALAPSEQADEEAGMSWREQEKTADRWKHNETFPSFCKKEITLTFFLQWTKIPLLALIWDHFVKI